MYTGVPTAVVGAMPSSALYFGTYEAVKTRLMRVAADKFPAAASPTTSGGGEGGDGEGDGGSEGVHPAARAGAHAVAAACGNAASSLIFVPKEYVKQTLQVGVFVRLCWRVVTVSVVLVSQHGRRRCWLFVYCCCLLLLRLVRVTLSIRFWVRCDPEWHIYVYIKKYV